MPDIPKNPKLKAMYLILETTRRCNMTCAHCLRGDAEALDMTEMLVRNVMLQMADVDEITFTGGEPSLNPKAMRSALKYAKRKKLHVRGAFLATNGKSVSSDFLRACRDWHAYCATCAAPPSCSDGWCSPDEARRIVRAMSDECEPCGLVVSLSMDEYHENIPLENVARLLTLPRVNDLKYHDPKDGSGWLLPEGRAALNGLSYENPREWEYGEQARELDMSLMKDRSYYVETLYISADGTVLKHCDYSYEDMDDYALGKIDTKAPDPGWVGRLAEKFYKDAE